MNIIIIVNWYVSIGFLKSRLQLRLIFYVWDIFLKYNNKDVVGLIQKKNRNRVEEKKSWILGNTGNNGLFYDEIFSLFYTSQWKISNAYE